MKGWGFWIWMFVVAVFVALMIANGAWYPGK